jgi:hypothetical protein
MIGGIQEPTRETLDELNRILGEGKYAISYARESAGLRTIVRTHERPAREWSTQFAPGDTSESVAATWQEFTSRIEKSEGTRVAAETGGTEAPRIVAGAGMEATSNTFEAGGGSAEESRAETADDVPTPSPAPSPAPSIEEGPPGEEVPEPPPQPLTGESAPAEHQKRKWF